MVAKPPQGREVTPIPAGQEPAFQAWLKQNNISDLDQPDSHYDYRGAFLAGINRGGGGHFPDTFKQHGHPTFSVESQYSRGPNDGGRWNGETFIPAQAAQVPTMNPDDLKALFWAAARAQQKGAKLDDINSALSARGAPPLNELAGMMFQKDVVSPAASIGLGMAQAATGGLGDEAAAGIQALIPSKGTTFSQRYAAAKAKELDTRNEHPLLAGAADAVTSAVLPGAGILKILKGGEKAGFLARTAKATAAAGATGLLGGAARGETQDQRLTYGLLGGATAGVAGAVGANVPEVAEFAKQYGRRMTIVRALKAGVRANAARRAGLLADAAPVEADIGALFPDPNPVTPRTGLLSPGDRSRFNQAFGARPANSPVYEVGSGPSSRVAMDLRTPGYDAAVGAPTTTPAAAMPSPMVATPAEAAATVSAKSARKASTDAAIAAYHMVYEATKDKELAKEAAARAAAYAGGAGGF